MAQRGNMTNINPKHVNATTGEGNKGNNITSLSAATGAEPKITTNFKANTQPMYMLIILMWGGSARAKVWNTHSSQLYKCHNSLYN